jgi:sulfatase modifying factor 1
VRKAAIAAAILLSACGHDPSALGSPDTCARYSGLPHGWDAGARAGMIRLAGGSVEVGSDRGYPEERPVRSARVEAFWIDRTEVTVAQYDSFVAATGHVTAAEKAGGSSVFLERWQLVADATWRRPQGGTAPAVAREPVVNVSYADAVAYARWLGRELPSEAQWEFAAKAGRGNERSDAALRDAKGRPAANFWQGAFPSQNLVEDGHAMRAPVGCYAANPFGLHDAVGNVWEWTTDADGAGRKVIKGGSYLCSTDYCARARPSSRQLQEVDLPAAHLGFRTVARD